LGGEFNAGFHYKRTPEWIERQRKMMKGTHLSDETKRKLSEINRNRDPAILEKISQSLKKSGAERAAKRKETLRRKHPEGIHLSAEHKAKLSAAMKGRKKSEETKAKMRKPKSPETVEKMREAQRISHRARKLGMTYKEYKEQQLTNLVGGK
jgi:Xaa-Pro aminopeptidase